MARGQIILIILGLLLFHQASADDAKPMPRALVLVYIEDNRATFGRDFTRRIETELRANKFEIVDEKTRNQAVRSEGLILAGPRARGLNDRNKADREKAERILDKSKSQVVIQVQIGQVAVENETATTRLQMTIFWKSGSKSLEYKEFKFRDAQLFMNDPGEVNIKGSGLEKAASELILPILSAIPSEAR